MVEKVKVIKILLLYILSCYFPHFCFFCSTDYVEQKEISVLNVSFYYLGLGEASVFSNELLRCANEAFRMELWEFHIILYPTLTSIHELGWIIWCSFVCVLNLLCHCLIGPFPKPSQLQLKHQVPNAWIKISYLLIVLKFINLNLGTGFSPK